ncbi:DUF4249 domain-containing protein [Puia sp. P3]|uniref:DUF4249 domain-containing protein n=1 Tax=Puia sp. P3 TaxID=3423952 RepID=UPI003D66EC39
MGPVKNIILVFVFSLQLCACQRVISVHLNSGATKYVIEGVVNDRPGGSRVSISQTKDFSSNNVFAGVSGAVVTIENNGSVYPLTETSVGVYTSSALTGVPGNTYGLRVVLSGAVYTAISTMPNSVVGIDSIYVSNGTLTDKRYATVVYSDPAGTPNYYRWEQYVNGRKEKTNFLGNDEFTDGLKIRTQLDFNNDTNDATRDVRTGDSIRVDMINLDSTVYQYWYALQQDADGSGGTASPANPVSNISGGVWGILALRGFGRELLLQGRNSCAQDRSVERKIRVVSEPQCRKNGVVVARLRAADGVGIPGCKASGK